MEQSKPDVSISSDNLNAEPAIQNNNAISDVAFEEIAKERKPESTTKEFLISDMKEEPSKIKVDFFAGQNPNSFISTPTEAAKPEAPSGNFINNPSNGIINTGSATKTKEEIRGNVATIIAILDYIISLLGLWLYGKGVQSAYTADATQKKLLETALVDFMFERQTKMPAWLALLLAFITCYGFMLGGGIKELMERKKKERETPPAPDIKNKTREDAKLNVVHATHTEVKAPQYSPPVQTQAIHTPSPSPLHDQIKKEAEAFKSSWYNPDPNIIANNREDVERYLAKGIFPMYKRNEGDKSKYRKVTYSEDGRPQFAGRMERVNKLPEKGMFKRKKV